MLVGVRLVGKDPLGWGNKTPRLIMVTVFDPVLAMTAAPVDSSIATPVEFVPVVTSAQGAVVLEPLDAAHFAGAGGLCVKSMTEAVPLPLLATTAKPLFCQMAIPCGFVPTVMGLPMSWPNVRSAGLRSRITTLLHPVTLTRPMGEKGPFAI